ncbi:hypothetical protein P7C70_g2092, partial [Phenoliferia sp. Uapishka_3]
MFSRNLLPTYLLPTPAVGEPSLQPVQSTSTPPSESVPVDVDDATQDTTMVADAEEDDEEVGTQSLDVIQEDEVAQTAPRTKASTSVLADAFFPSRATMSNDPAPNHKRLSLPASLIPRASTRSPARSANSSSSNLARKSLSPSHTLSRSTSLHSSTKRNPSESLFAPLTSQLHALKTRNASLEAMLKAQSSSGTSDLFRATERIRSLEGGLEDGVRKLEEEVQRKTLESEGWEAEAVRLGKELESVEGGKEEFGRLKEELERTKAELETETSYRKRYKTQVGRMRSELGGRRLREKWELAIMDAEDRKTDATIVGLEYDVAMLTLQTALDKIRIEELDEIIDEQCTKLDALKASRLLLLTSFNTSEANVADLHVELAASKKDSEAVRKDLAVIEDAKGEAEEALASSLEKIQELEGEMKRAKEDLARLEKGEKSSEAKETRELAEARKALLKEAKELAETTKALDREKAARIKADAEIKEAKANLKEAQFALREASKSLATKTKEAEAATVAAESIRTTLAEAKAKAKASKASAPLPSVKALAARKRRSLTKDGSDPVDILEPEPAEESIEEEEVADEPMEEDVEDEEEQAAVLPPAPSRKARPATIVPTQAEIEVNSLPPGSADEDSYRPVKSKSRAAPVPSRRAAKAALVVEEEQESTPVAPTATKKRKAADEPAKTVLVEKSTNKRPKADKVVPSAVAVGKKRDVSVAVEETVDVVVAPVAKAEPAKKKKKKLLGGPQKFDWGTIETGDINGLGLPSTLSPVKGGAGRKASVSLGAFGGGRTSIFG